MMSVVNHIVGVAALTLLACLVQGPVAKADPIELKYTTHLPGGNPTTDELIHWADRINEKSNGRLAIKVFVGGQMGPPPRTFDLVRTGVADIGFVLNGATPGRFPMTELTHLPGVLPDVLKSGPALTEVAPEFLAAENPGVKILFYMTDGQISLVFAKKRVKALDDLKGLRIRAAGSVQADSLLPFGVVPTNVQPGDLSDALSKGMIDGAAVSYTAAAVFKLQDVVASATEVDLGATTLEVVMNKAVYDKLPADLQKIIDAESGEVGARALAQVEQGQNERSKALLVKSGVVIDAISAQDTRAISDKIVEDAMAKAEAKGMPARAFIAKLRKSIASYPSY
jgi:TRAP-type transport system periplasmic protein